MSETTAKPSLVDRAAGATPMPVARRILTLSDRAIAWLFIAPTIVLLLAINIFPLIWTIYLSFTDFKRIARTPRSRASVCVTTSAS